MVLLALVRSRWNRDAGCALERDADPCRRRHLTDTGNDRDPRRVVSSPRAWRGPEPPAELVCGEARGFRLAAACYSNRKARAAANMRTTVPTAIPAT